MKDSEPKNLFNEEGVNLAQKFKTIDDLQTKIDDYFRSCYKAEKDAEGQIYYTSIKPLTIQSLTFHCGCVKETWWRYANGVYDTPNNKFSEAIAMAKARIEAWTSEALYTQKNQVASIFNLKSNYNWQDTTKIDMNHSGNINISFNDDDNSDEVKEDFQD
jgi:hypothetical protein